jgi:hypothetical protein
MKKIFLAFIALVFFLSFVDLASANLGKEGGVYYVAKKGDTVWRIATKVFHISWWQVKPEMRSKNLIYIGDKFQLQDFLVSDSSEWLGFNQNPFKKHSVLSEEQLGRDRRGLEILGLNQNEIDRIIKLHITVVSNHSEQGFRWGQIGYGDYFDKVLFGNFFLLRNVTVKWEKGKEQAARVYKLSDGRELWYPLICGNWAIKSEKPERKVELFLLPQPPPLLEPPPKPPVFLAKEVKRPLVKVVSKEEEEGCEECELFAGGITYEHVDIDEIEGHSGWAKGRCYLLKEKITPTLNLKLGAFGFVSYWHGEVRDYKYRGGKKPLIYGPSLGLDNPYWNADFDFGLFGRREDKGGIAPNYDYRSEQENDDFYTLAANFDWYKRRKQGKRVFPQVVFGLDIDRVDIAGTNHQHYWKGNKLVPNPVKNNRWEGQFKLALYDFYPSWRKKNQEDERNKEENKTGLVRFTPTFNLGAGYEKAQKEYFRTIGFGVDFAYKGKTLLHFSPYNYRESSLENADQWRKMSFWVSIWDTLKAIGDVFEKTTNNSNVDPLN